MFFCKSVIKTVNASDQNSTQDSYDYVCFMFESISLRWELYFPKEECSYKEHLELLTEAG